MSTRLCLVLCLLAAACGGKNDQNADCPAPLKPTNESCADHNECCSGLCNGGTCAETSGQCVAAGGTCISSADCCAGQCADDGSGNFTCGAGYGACQPLTQSCGTANDCCSLGCHGGTCDETICATSGQDCTADSDCCSNLCNASGKCEVPAGCYAAGESCDADSKCCSQNCVDTGANGMRCGPSGACRVVGEVCTDADDCCSFNCNKGAGEMFGTCTKLPSTNACNTVGEVCQEDAHCCSLYCRDNGTGFKSCGYISGCRPAYELCRDDSDCCNATVQATAVCDKQISGSPVGRCLNPPGDAPSGEICGDAVGNPVGSNTCAGAQGQGSANANCQSSGTDLPFRCETGDATCFGPGTTCAHGAECCSGICAPDANGNLVCDPVDSCRMDGEACTADGDCCNGFCDPQTLTCGTIIL